MPSWLNRRVVLGLVFAVVLLAALVWAFAPQPVPADFATVSRGPLAVMVEEEGETRVKDVYTVSAPVAGRLTRIEAEVGDPVVRGETVLAEIRPSDPTILDVRSRAELESAIKAAEAAHSLAEADVRRAEAELDFARAELRRAEPLAAKGTISAAALDRATLGVRKQSAYLEEARASERMRAFELETAKARLIEPGSGNPAGSAEGLCCVAVPAPVSGRVLRVLQESEAVLAAGTPLIEIGDDRDLEIVTDLLSNDAVRVDEGDPVLIEDWGGEGTLSGVVRRVEPFGFTKISALGIEEQRVNVIIDFVEAQERWRRLGHGYRLDAGIVIWEAEDVLRVPVSALFRVGDDWAVFKVVDGEARVTIVEIGQRNALSAEVISGLSEGDTVIVHASDRVADGVAVEERDGSL